MRAFLTIVMIILAVLLILAALSFGQRIIRTVADLYRNRSRRNGGR